jgi:hypothetical protein
VIFVKQKLYRSALRCFGRFRLINYSNNFIEVPFDKLRMKYFELTNDILCVQDDVLIILLNLNKRNQVTIHIPQLHAEPVEASSRRRFCRINLL